MPELPEVEVTRRGLLSDLPGRLITAVRCGRLRLRAPLPAALLCAHIAGQRITTIDRRAKYLLFRMESGAVLVAHLGMTGKFGVMTADAPLHKHDHLVLVLDNGLEVRYNDSRRFGSIVVWPAGRAMELEGEFSAREGIEPFSPQFNGRALQRLAAGRTAPVKALLMNSRLVSGIGNIYANEMLFAARIDPETPAGALTLRQWNRLVRVGVDILARAIEAGGSTVADFLSASGHPGYFQLQHHVYGRDGQPCRRCGQSVTKTVLAGRSTYSCRRCQPPGPAGAADPAPLAPTSRRKKET